MAQGSGRRQTINRAGSVRGIGLALMSSTAILLGAAGGLIGSATPARAQQAATQYAVPAGPLASAITRFGEASGLQILYPADLVRGKQSPGVSGSYSRDEALSQLLAGSGLTFRYTAGNTLTLEAAGGGAGDSAVDGALNLGTITLVGAGNAVTEGTGSYTTGAMSATTRFALAVHETPQAVTVVTRQKMDDQAMTGVQDVVRNSTGLSLRKWGGERPRYYARGFVMDNFMLDGLPVNYEADTFTDSTLAIYDHVEVVRGATGLVTGTGEPSGTMNFVRKRPGDERRTSITGSIGSWADYRGELDVGGPLNEAGTIRGRFVTSLQDKNSYIRDYESKRQLYYGTFEFDLGDATTLSIGGYYNREDNPGADWNGLGTNPDGTFLDIDRSTRLSPTWSYWDKETSNAFIELEHQFDNGWQAKAALRRVSTKMDMRGSFLQLPVRDASGNVSYQLRAGKYDYTRDQTTFDAWASGPVELFGREHELVFGASYRDSANTDRGAAYNTATGGFDLTTIDPYTWDPGSFPVPPIYGYWGQWSRTTEIKNTSVYAAGRFALSDDLTLVSGGRFDWYDYTTTTDDAGWITSKGYKENGEFTPYAGLIWQLNDSYSLYASYTSIFKPQGQSTDAAGNALDPITGKNYEIGFKGTWMDERLNFGASLFRIVQQNLPESLPSSACSVGWECYRGVGEVEGKGIDLEISGEIIPRLNLMAGYTYTHAEVTRGSNTGVAGDRYNTSLPEHQLKISTVYHLPGKWEGWRIGGAVRWQSEITSVSFKDTYPAFGITPVVQDAFTVADLVVGYRLSDTFDIQLNVNNVFDKYYYETVGGFEGSNSFGAPRSFMLTAKATF
ncbi:TonB-dependent siderophore receptor [Xinfangfangia sp. D13-10-4-6]|uniref:TonB-dependent siderophore receptor n=1 Tax=Pseudogemmobacter hezensis TaxID=2737662 RepID=UPI001554AD2A|nr:TonB-dependent receptor [Pseudogemmobacter hezensis]NPD14904.1 TonB-dependent siderophore receptor [Pseudogemmobacter hezensis]